MWSEPILHIDMDAFFVEVERLDDPALRGRPVAVGGTGTRGVIASASYEARSYGVRSAQPTAVARGLCRDLVVVSPSHERYGEISSRVFAIFREHTPLVEGLGLDEAFLDVAGLRRHYESPVQIGLAIRERVKGQVGLPASVGIASSKFLAKLASQAAKPDGLRHIPSSVQLEFLHALSVEALWGVGPATLAGLHRLGVVTIGDLAAVPESTLKSTMGPGQGAHLSRLANAIDDRPVEPHSNAKSISVEETYQKDLVGRDLIESALMAHAQRLSMRLRRAGLAGRTVTLKLRFSDFTTVTRSRTYATGISDPRELYTASLMLLDQIPSRQPVRLLGLGGSSFEDHSAPRQDSLDSDDAWQRIARAVADVEDKYGAGSVAPARTLHLTADDEDDPPTDL